MRIQTQRLRDSYDQAGEEREDDTNGLEGRPDCLLCHVCLGSVGSKCMLMRAEGFTELEAEMAIVPSRRLLGNTGSKEIGCISRAPDWRSAPGHLKLAKGNLSFTGVVLLP